MKILKVLALLTCLLIPVAASAAPGWQRNITVDWWYEVPTDLTVSGFKLYQETLPACEWSIPTIRTGACSVVLIKRFTSFTLSALFSDGTESPQSEPYVLNDWGPKPTIIKVTPK